MRFTCLKNIHAAAFFVIKCPYGRKFKVLQIMKIPSLVNFRNFYQLLHLQVYRNGLKL